MKEARGVVAVILFSCLVCCFVGWIIGEDMTRKTWQAECVKRNFAEHNPKTGEWQWKDDEKHNHNECCCIECCIKRRDSKKKCRCGEPLSRDNKKMICGACKKSGCHVCIKARDSETCCLGVE